MSETSHPSVLTQSYLAHLTGYVRQSEIEAELQRQGVRYSRGRRGIWTTVDALNAALGVGEQAPEKPVRLDF
jgi:hypothetical protein